MITFLLLVSVIGTILILLVIMAGLLGKIPVHLVLKVNAAIAGMCWIAAMVRGSGFSIAVQCIGFVCWAAAVIIHRYHARRLVRH